MAKRINRILTSGERRKKAKRIMLFRLYGFVIVTLLFFGGLVYLLRAEYFRLSNVEVAGASEQSKEEILKMATETFKGNKFLFVPNNQALFYSADGLKNNIETKLSSVQETAIDVSFPKTLKIEVKERAPRSIYCEEACYFVDSKGIIYAPAPSYSDGIYMTFRDLTRATSSNPVGTPLADSQTFELVQKYLDSLPELGLHPTTVIFNTKLEIKIELQGNGYILINLDRTYNETVQNITTVIQEGVKEFQYIDVRFGNKIFYKEKMI